jgi:hypothetical protein
MLTTYSDQTMAKEDTAIDLSVSVSDRTITIHSGPFRCGRRDYVLVQDETFDIPKSSVDISGIGWLVIEKSSGEPRIFFHMVERGEPDPFIFPVDAYEPLHDLLSFSIPAGVPNFDGGSIVVNRVVAPEVVDHAS